MDNTQVMQPEQFLEQLRAAADAAHKSSELLKRPSKDGRKLAQQIRELGTQGWAAAKAALSAELARPLSKSQLKEAEELIAIFKSSTQTQATRRDSQLDDAKAELPRNTVWAEGGLMLNADSIDEVAEILLAEANRLKRPVAFVLSGAVLCAQPEDDLSKVVGGWDNQLLERMPGSWLVDLQARLETKVDREAERSGSPKPPRRLEELIGWAKRAHGYADYLLNGLAELRHPDEIRLWVRHFVDMSPELPFRDAETGEKPTAPEAQQLAIENMKGWVNEFGTVAEGSAEHWNRAIAELAQSLKKSSMGY